MPMTTFEGVEIHVGAAYTESMLGPALFRRMVEYARKIEGNIEHARKIEGSIPPFKVRTVADMGDGPVIILDAGPGTVVEGPHATVSLSDTVPAEQKDWLKRLVRSLAILLMGDQVSYNDLAKLTDPRVGVHLVAPGAPEVAFADEEPAPCP